MTREKLAAIRARCEALQVSDSTVASDYWPLLADIPALLAEVARLRALVEAAYREAWVLGDDATLLDSDWADSDARRALDGGA